MDDSSHFITPLLSKFVEFHPQNLLVEIQNFEVDFAEA